MPTDTSEKGLERLICTALAGHPCDPPASDTMSDPPAGYGGAGWIGGNPHDYDREYCVDLVQLSAFLHATQPGVAESLDLDHDSPTRRGFLARLQGEISKRGVIDALRKGVKHGAHDLDLFYGAPTPGNETARERFEQNRFSVTRQLRYSRDETQRALDIGLFINGLPVFTFELKNSLTKQTVADAIERVITEDLPEKVAADKAYQNAVANSDRQNARIEHDKALERAVTELLADHTELFKQFSDNESFRKWLSETVFAATYRREAETGNIPVR